MRCRCRNRRCGNAAALAREGMRVCVIDAGGIAGGTTAAGMGHIVVMDDSPAQFALTKYSLDLWEEFAEGMPATCEYDRCGTIWVAADEEEMQEVRRKHVSYASHGVATEILDEKLCSKPSPTWATVSPAVCVCPATPSSIN